MGQSLVFAPMGALAVLTFAVLLLIPIRRFQAGAAGQIVRDDFKFGESPSAPGHASRAAVSSPPRSERQRVGRGRRRSHRAPAAARGSWAQS